MDESVEPGEPASGSGSGPDGPAPTLRGRAVLITGAGQGVGRGLALAAGAAGGSVVVTARRTDAAEKVAAEVAREGGEALAVTCDVTRPEDVRRAVDAAVDRFGRLDALVHNATSRHSSRPAPLEEMDEQAWDDHVAVGLRATYHLARAGLDALRAVGGTFVVLVSTAGIEGSAPLPAYAAVKGAQRGLVKGLAREWGPSGIRVNALAPVAVTEAMDAFIEREPEVGARLSARAALRRLGDPREDIGRALTFLAGPDSRFVTGQTLVVNGGALLW